MGAGWINRREDMGLLGLSTTERAEGTGGGGEEADVSSTAAPSDTRHLCPHSRLSSGINGGRGWIATENCFLRGSETVEVRRSGEGATSARFACRPASSLVRGPRTRHRPTAGRRLPRRHVQQWAWSIVLGSFTDSVNPGSDKIPSKLFLLLMWQDWQRTRRASGLTNVPLLV